MSVSGTRAVTDFNLDEFERRLRTAGSLPTGVDDPLFELARLVESSKPESAKGAAAASTKSGEPAPLEGTALRPALEEAEFHGEPESAEEPQPAPATISAEPELRGHDGTGSPPKRRAIGWTMRISALAVAGAAMIGAVVALKGKVPGLPRQAPYIAATQGPTKVAPPSDDTVSAPNEVGANLLKDNTQSTHVKVVASEEQPVDLNALASTAPSSGAAATPPAPVASSAGSAVMATADAPVVVAQPAVPSPALSQFPDPKPVRTVSLRPDGTLIPTPAVASEDSSVAVPPVDAPKPMAKAPPKPAADAAAAAQPSTPRLDLPTKLSGKSSARVAVAKTDTTAPASIAEASNEPLQLGSMTKPEKAAKAAKAQVAAAEPATPAAPDQTVDAAATKSGGWAVQLAAPKSEAEAKTVMSRLSAKYASALNGSAIGVHKATVNGETIYRLRVAGLSKADAAALCARLKGDGADCFIAK